MLKKSVMIPLKIDDNGNQIENVSNADHPFCRGVMAFDDYNYTLHNKYVLVEDPREIGSEESPDKKPLPKNLSKMQVA